jgi:hypothetical protein
MAPEAEESGARFEATKPLTTVERLMEAWLLAEQAINRAGEDSADRAELIRRADAARDRYQAALDGVEPDLDD